MRTLKQRCGDKCFLVSSGMIVTLLLIIQGIYSKVDSFKWANQYHGDYLDYFFIAYTSLGDGLFALFMVCLLLIVKRFQLALKVFFSFALSGILVIAAKNIWLAPRPSVVLTSDIYTHFIHGITRGGFSSFPSGHTTTAFALAATLALNSRSHILKIVYLVLALGVGYSRVYLGQHFIPDITGGAVLGILVSLLTEYLYVSRTFRFIKWQRPQNTTDELAAA